MKRILILGAGPEQAIAIREAKKLNYSVIACDQNLKAADLSLANDCCIVKIDRINNKYCCFG